MNNRVRIISYGAVLIAMNIVLTRILGFDVGAARISFTFIPQVLGSVMFGPWIGALLALIADVLGQILKGGAPWLGFCINTVLYGISYGLFLYKRPASYKRIIPCVILQGVIIDALLGSLWFYHYMGMPYLAALLSRAPDALLMIPVKIISIKYMLKFIGDRIKV